MVIRKRIHAAPLILACHLLLVALCLLLLPGCAQKPTAPSSAMVPTQTAIPTATPQPTLPTVVATRTPAPTPTFTPTPTLTPTPTPLPGASLIAFETTRDGNAEIYLLDTESGELTNLTRHPAEDRNPAWCPDGGALAFESHRDGNWEIYLLDLSDGTLTRLTNDPAYDGAPAWSPDGTQIAFESYRDGNLEIYVAAAGGQPRRLTEDKAGDYGPAWSPDGQWIAFASWRDGNKEIYLAPAAGGEAINLTQNPADDESPAWSPAPPEGGTGGQILAFVSWRDVEARTGCRNAEIYRMPAAGPFAQGEGIAAGKPERLTDNPWPDLDPAWDAAGKLVWAAYDPGPPFETYDPYRPGDYYLYRQGKDAPVRLTESGWDDRRPAPAPAQVVSLERLLVKLPPEPQPPAPMPTLAPDTLAEVVEVTSILAAGQPILVNELVSPSLVAWQQALIEASGHDLLHQTLGSWRNIDQVRRKAMYAYDYGYLSWHKAGRALDLPLEYTVDGIDQMLVTREDFGGIVTWRMYLRAARQDGSQGEPLKDNPWRYWWHIVKAEEPKAYDAGGKRLPIPAGYYVDVTEIAKRHGWERIAAYAIEGDYHWNTDSNGTEYWHYERTDGLIWWDAMLQIYPAEQLEQHAGWKTALDKAQSREMMLSKGIPTPRP